MMMHPPAGGSVLGAALHQCRGRLVAVAVFSAATNFLMLVSPVYMLQIYDRVLSSASYETLVALTAVAIFLLVCFGLLDWVRQRLMARLALLLNFAVVDPVLTGVYQGSLQRFRRSAGQPIRDLDTLRQFIASPPALAFFDVPWIPFFIGVIFLIHVWLGVLGICSALVILMLALLTEWTVRTPYRSASEHAVSSQRFAENSLRHADVLAAMGMYAGFRRRWRDRHDRAVALQMRGGARLGVLLSASKAFRQIVQVGVLGLGAWLVLRQELTPGMMIAASIVLGRALAPIEQGISAWRSFVAARQAWHRLDVLLQRVPPASAAGTHLPRPEGLLEVADLVAAPPGTPRPVLRGVSFVLKPGSVSALIGPSGSGKSTLTRLLVGVWSAQSGTVRLDGPLISEWSADSRLQHIGYLPQEVELFEGTVAENIARLTEPDDAAVLAAARLAHCHELIMRQPEHYDTLMTDGGANLSAGQRQRVALARALYGDPVLVVLDEPDANLDTEGQLALAGTLRDLASRRVTVLLVTHNLQLLQEVGYVMVLREGALADAGPAREVLQRYTRPLQSLAQDG